VHIPPGSQTHPERGRKGLRSERGGRGRAGTGAERGGDEGSNQEREEKKRKEERD